MILKANAHPIMEDQLLRFVMWNWISGQVLYSLSAKKAEIVTANRRLARENSAMRFIAESRSQAALSSQGA
jgi:hypothetical protein